MKPQHLKTIESAKVEIEQELTGKIVIWITNPDDNKTYMILLNGMRSNYMGVIFNYAYIDPDLKKLTNLVLYNFKNIFEWES